jgi:hypothetical protein
MLCGYVGMVRVGKVSIRRYSISEVSPITEPVDGGECWKTHRDEHTRLMEEAANARGGQGWWSKAISGLPRLEEGW